MRIEIKLLANFTIIIHYQHEFIKILDYINPCSSNLTQ